MRPNTPKFFQRIQQGNAATAEICKICSCQKNILLRYCRACRKLRLGRLCKTSHRSDDQGTENILRNSQRNLLLLSKEGCHNDKRLIFHVDCFVDMGLLYLSWDKEYYNISFSRNCHFFSISLSSSFISYLLDFENLPCRFK